MARARESHSETLASISDDMYESAQEKGGAVNVPRAARPRVDQPQLVSVALPSVPEMRPIQLTHLPAALR